MAGRHPMRGLLKVIKYSSVLAVGATSVAVLKHNEWDVRSVGLLRFGRAAMAAAAVVADYKISMRGIDEAHENYISAKSEQERETVDKINFHRRSALRLREMCCQNGGCFIKVGQHLAALEYLLPPEYIEVMKVLHSDAPQTPVQNLYSVLEEDLGKPVSEVFTSIDDKPLGTASLAQVHHATLKDGTEVAVKIQHPHVREHAFVDMATMELLVRGVSLMFPEFQFMWLAEETKRNLPLELDFYNEGKNCERVAKMFSHLSFLKIPKVHWDLTTGRVLTMEYCRGGQVNDRNYMKQNKISVNDVSRKLGQLYSEMIFEQGYIHCDPHPGNVLVEKTDKGTQIVLLDHGLYQTLTDDFRMNYCGLWQSILKADVDGIQRHSENMGVGKLFPLFACIVTARSWDAVSEGVDKKEFTPDEDVEIKAGAAQYLPEIATILNDLPRQMLLILKTNDLLRGIESTLRTRANAKSFLTMSKCCVRAVAKDKRKKCQSFFPRLLISLREQWSLFGISVYEYFLWLRTTSIAQVFSDFQMKKAITAS